MELCDRFFVNVDTLSLGRGNKGEGFFPAALGRAGGCGRARF